MYNEKFQKFSNLLNHFNFNNDENKFNEMFKIFNKSIINIKEILEYKEYLDKNNYNLDYYVFYKGETIKGTNIKNGKGIEYGIYKDIKNNIIFKGEYLNGESWNGKGKEYYDNVYLKFESEYLNGKRWN